MEENAVPRVRITQDTLWYDRAYSKGDVVAVEGREYLDLLMAGRIESQSLPAHARPATAGNEQIEGRHRGELVFVLGNGPSLAIAGKYAAQLGALAAIGVNRTFRLLKTRYLLFLDASLWTAESEAILACGSEVFCPKRLGLPYFASFGRFHAKNPRDVLSTSWSDGLYWSRSSTAAALNLASLFGASEIALLGVDLLDNSHFYSERGRGQPFPHAGKILEDLWWMSRRLHEKGIRLWNCSPRSAVRGFEKIEFGALIERR